MSLINILENEFVGFPPQLVDVVRFLVYVNIENHFIIQLNNKCMLSDHCVGEINDPVVEL